MRRLPDPHHVKDRNVLRVKSNFVLTIILAASTLTAALPVTAAAQVGHAPNASPYHYIPGSRSVSLTAGYVWGDVGRAGVGPSNGMLISARADIRLSGAVGVTLNGGVLALERTVIAPQAPLTERNLGVHRQSVPFADLGLELLLTGRKTWRGFAPYIGGSIGVGVSQGVPEEQSGFSFGSKFFLVPNAGVRYHLSDRISLNMEMRDMVWRLSYPEKYFQVGEDGSASVLDTAVHRNKEWTDHFVLTLGLAYGFGF